MDNIVLCNTDCIRAMKHMAENSIDAVVTDPPAGIAFMGKSWDDMGDLMGFQNFIHMAFTEVYRVLKPGGHCLVWALPRTSHHTAMGIERAGFEIRDVVNHIFATGFPKSMNIGKAIDKMQGNEREVVGERHRNVKPYDDASGWNANNTTGDFTYTKGNSDWEGWGTALKPAVEHWILCRKPISERTIVENCLKWGVGALAIDNCRIATTEDLAKNYKSVRKSDDEMGERVGKFGFRQGKDSQCDAPSASGRWPANLTLECICDEVIIAPTETKEPEEVSGGIFSPSTGKPAGRTYKGGEQIHTNPECPCYMLDQQSGVRPGWSGQKHNAFNPYGGHALNKSKTERSGDFAGFKDTGGASRFFFTAKPSRKERDKGCEKIEAKAVAWSNQAKAELARGNLDFSDDERKHNKVEMLRNNHPTVKSIALMRYLITMITKEGQIVLDPFAGSFTTGVACVQLNRKFIGIEKEKDYFIIGKARITAAKKEKEDANLPPQ